MLSIMYIRTDGGLVSERNGGGGVEGGGSGC